MRPLGGMPAADAHPRVEDVKAVLAKKITSRRLGNRNSGAEPGSGSIEAPTAFVVIDELHSRLATQAVCGSAGGAFPAPQNRATRLVGTLGELDSAFQFSGAYEF
jgi:hypothetical protein